MLARVAERIYWLSRYMERIENTARLVNVYSNLLMDLPKGSKLGWETLIAIIGSDDLYGTLYEGAHESNILRFTLVQKENPASIVSILLLARENARTSREIIPAEAWELINDLYVYTKENSTQGVTRAHRHDFLNKIISASQRFTGLLSGCMSHNDAYDFVIIGRNLERADMSSRIIDVGAAALLQQEEEADSVIPYESSMWMNILRSLSAYQMYRQHVPGRVNAEDVVMFLLKDEEFPRAVLHCLHRLTEAAQGLPNNENCLRVAAATRRRVAESDTAELLKQGGIYVFIDELQLEIGNIHHAVAVTWFASEISADQLQTGS